MCACCPANSIQFPVILLQATLHDFSNVVMQNLHP